jgi:hypothetical protein
MSTERLPGVFDQHDQGPAVISEQDKSLSAVPAWTTGAVRTSTPSVRATLTESWRVVGFSMRCHAVLSPVPGSALVWGRLGDVWAGLAFDTSLSDAGADNAGNSSGRRGTASLPQDLSTFTKLLVGADDTLPVVAAALTGLPDLSVVPAAVFGTTFMFPTPIDLRAGSQIQMALIKTPSLTQGVLFSLLSADYTLLYEQA